MYIPNFPMTNLSMETYLKKDPRLFKLPPLLSDLLNLNYLSLTSSWNAFKHVLNNLFQGFDNQESLKKGMDLCIIICYFPIHLGKLNF